MDYLLLGKQIRRRRQALGWTQEQLAEAIGVSTSFIGHIERGSRKASIDTLVELANALEVSADYLLSTNLNSVNRGLIPEYLSKNQRLVLQEILSTLQGQLGNWNEEGDPPANDC